jgi:hypothetical protein
MVGNIQAINARYLSFIFNLLESIKPLVFGAPFGMVLNAIHFSRYLEVRRFEYGRNQRYVIPKAAVVGLAGKLPVI